ncbi:MAG: hypothetical protein ACE5JU_21425, partial [Candidatus Binatia bacterium]
MIVPTTTRAVIDSGLVFTVLTLNYVERAALPGLKGAAILKRAVDAEIVESESTQQEYLLLFRQIRTPLITSHVVGELQGLQSSRLRLRGEDLRYFWLHSLEFLLMSNFDEKLVRLLDMNGREDIRDAIYRCGPADAGLIDLARSERYDGPLRARTHAFGVGARPAQPGRGGGSEGGRSP